MWDKFKAWLKNSETIAWARLQAAAGAIVFALQMPELLTILASGGDISWPQLIVAGALVANGFVTEYLRRRRAEDM